MVDDHPIFIKSIMLIREALGDTGLEPLQQQVLERLIHSSGDLSLVSSLHFSPGACEAGINALIQGAKIVTDTAMATAAVKPMAKRTLGTVVQCVLDWAPENLNGWSTRSEAGMSGAWKGLAYEKPPPLVLIGSAPTALDLLLKQVAKGAPMPSLIIGMPVGFVGVEQSKRDLAESGLPQIRLEGSRGGAALVGAAVNALLRVASGSDLLLAN